MVGLDKLYLLPYLKQIIFCKRLVYELINGIYSAMVTPLYSITLCFPGSEVFFFHGITIAWGDIGCLCEFHGWSLYMHKIRLCSMQWYATLDCNISNIAYMHKNVKIELINEDRWGGGGGDYFPWRCGKCREGRVWSIFSKNTHAHVSGIKLPGAISEGRKLTIGVSGTRIDVLDSNNVVDVETCAVLPIGSWRYPSVACTTPVAGR